MLTFDQVSTCTTTSVYDKTSLHTANNTPHAGLSDNTHDTSSVTGQIGSFSLAGTVTSSFYTSNDCTTGSSTAGSGTVSSTGSVGNSNTSAALAAGGYSYQASYGGNANYASSTGPCEKFTVDQGSTGTPTSVYDETSLQTVNNTTHAGLGDKTHDTSSVTGQIGSFSLAGTVTYSFYPSNFPTRRSSAPGSSTISCASNSVGNSNTSAALAAGGYSYQAS